MRGRESASGPADFYVSPGDISFCYCKQTKTKNQTKTSWARVWSPLRRENLSYFISLAHSAVGWEKDELMIGPAASTLTLLNKASARMHCHAPHPVRMLLGTSNAHSCPGWEQGFARDFRRSTPVLPLWLWASTWMVLVSGGIFTACFHFIPMLMIQATLLTTFSILNDSLAPPPGPQTQTAF